MYGVVTEELRSGELMRCTRVGDATGSVRHRFMDGIGKVGMGLLTCTQDRYLD